MFLLRPLRIISLLLLLAIVGSVWWGWRRVHRSDAPSAKAAVASVARETATVAGVPRPGVYLYAAVGTERIGIGPLTVGRKLPSQALLVVRPRGGVGRTVEWQLSGDHSESWQTVTGATGIRGTQRKLRIGTFGVNHTVSGAAQPPVMLYPRRMKVDQAWESVYRVSGIVFHRTSRVQRKDSIPVGGVPVKVYVIAIAETVTGTLHGQDQITEWYAPSLGIPVRAEWHRTLDGTVVNVLTEALVLKSLSPAS